MNIIFKSRLDKTSYIFKPANQNHGKPTWKREDTDLCLIHNDRLGWVIIDSNKNIYAISWDFIVAGQHTPMPPVGEWVSKKGDKSYVYSLEYENNTGK